MVPSNFLKQFAPTAPDLPGVYQFLSVKDEILYIGKAKNLKNRLKSYLQPHSELKTEILVSKVEQCTLTVTANEEEALILEQKLIRQHKPPYNILLKDDRSYPYIVLSRHQYPLIKTYRGSLSTEQLKHAFGPYPSAEVAKKTLEVLIDAFQLRTCSDHTFISRSRPCLQHQIHRCSAPCVGLISKEDYHKSVQKVRDFLKCSSDEVIEFLVKKMQDYSNTEQYEKAGLLCQHIKQLRSLQRRTVEVEMNHQRVDVVSMQWPYVHHMMIAGGDIISSSFHILKTQGSYSDSEALSAMLDYLYSPLDKSWVPDLILSDNFSLSSIPLLGSSIEVRSCKGETENTWLEMVKNSLWQNINHHSKKSEFFKSRFLSLESALGIELIESIECLDISHFSGEHTLGGVVRISPEGLAKSLYRRYKIQKPQEYINDDCFSVSQVTLRHLKKRSEQNRLPSVLLIDGGKGQLRAAVLAREELGLSVPIFSIAKGEKRLFGEETIYSYNLAQDTFEIVQINKLAKAFHLLGQIRDEAHRFSIQSVRSQAAKKTQSNPLDNFKGIGPKKKKELLSFFGGWQGLIDASMKQLIQVKGIGPKLAKELYDYLKSL